MQNFDQTWFVMVSLFACLACFWIGFFYGEHSEKKNWMVERFTKPKE